MSRAPVDELRRRWLAGAARVHFGSCGTCRRVRTADDRPLLVVRADRCRRFVCLDCFAAPPRRRRRSEAAA